MPALSNGWARKTVWISEIFEIIKLCDTMNPYQKYLIKRESENIKLSNMERGQRTLTKTQCNGIYHSESGKNAQSRK